jgi:hypothetical protein
MTIEAIFTAISGGCTFIGVLFGGGMLNRHIKQREELAVLRDRYAKLEDRVTRIDDKVIALDRDGTANAVKFEVFERAMRNLERIPEIAAKLDATVSAVSRLQEVVDDLAARRHE